MCADKTRSRRRVLTQILNCFLGLLILLSVLLYLSAKWYIHVCGNRGFDSILYTLLSDMNGVQSGLLGSYMAAVLPPLILLTASICLILFSTPRKKLMLTLFHKCRIRLYPFPKALYICMAIGLSACLLLRAAVLVQLPEYLEARNDKSTIFEEHYRDPRTVQVTFPEEKRNLIFIYLESMETSYQSRELGGSKDVNLIPELTALAQENTSFSTTDQLTGPYPAPGTGWTIAAMLAQTSGVPLILPPGYTGNDYGDKGAFLPGLCTLSDLLHQNGYYQMLMVGSDAAFGGRDAYYSTHGTDRIYDISDARESGLLPSPDYDVWWGMEDYYLYTCAKAELLSLAQREEPFALTLLTVDTHHIGGYLCPQCGNSHEEQYENVIACASKQLHDFVSWLQQQDFYANTTIVICGDHPSMDNDYFVRQAYSGDSRRTYNCIINAPIVPAQTKNRVFTVFDLFPTTVAALGCSIQGERLGLGTNLYSSVATLPEEMGLEAFTQELRKYTDYYLEHFFFSQ